MPVNMTSIIKMWKDAQAEANKANEARFQDIMGMYGGGGQSMWDLSSQFGQGERRRISQGMTQAQGQAEQDLISRGLGGTTVRSAVRRGIRSSAEDATQDLEDRVARQRMDIIGGRAGVTERRTDAGPDAGLFASMMMSAANQPTTDAGGVGGVGGVAALGTGGQRSRGTTYNFPPGWYDQFSSSTGGAQRSPQAAAPQPAATGGDGVRWLSGGGELESQGITAGKLNSMNAFETRTGRKARVPGTNQLTPEFEQFFAQQQSGGTGDGAAEGGMDWGGLAAGGIGMLSSLIPGMAGVGANVSGLSSLIQGLGFDTSSWGTPENLFGSLFGG